MPTDKQSLDRRGAEKKAGIGMWLVVLMILVGSLSFSTPTHADVVKATVAVGTAPSPVAVTL